MSMMTNSPKRSLNNAGYPVQDRFAFDFGKLEEFDGFLPLIEIDLGLF
jgi:hypothetical protein